ncbi:hypothetical protein PBY51_013933 [Eleginops maclovinus]|uniref:Uncharacterized protein n=1 Tax=Eleginops maclovinus TaxID=56733 RepID=A0AAN8AC50_ELEMC|nr:hypothetical protein PBY51_013933 [Eleginops maclovinus]
MEISGAACLGSGLLFARNRRKGIGPGGLPVCSPSLPGTPEIIGESAAPPLPLTGFSPRVPIATSRGHKAS